MTRRCIIRVCQQGALYQSVSRDAAGSAAGPEFEDQLWALFCVCVHAPWIECVMSPTIEQMASEPELWTVVMSVLTTQGHTLQIIMYLILFINK